MELYILGTVDERTDIQCKDNNQVGLCMYCNRLYTFVKVGTRCTRQACCTAVHSTVVGHVLQQILGTASSIILYVRAPHFVHYVYTINTSSACCCTDPAALSR